MTAPNDAERAVEQLRAKADEILTTVTTCRAAPYDVDRLANDVALVMLHLANHIERLELADR